MFTLETVMKICASACDTGMCVGDFVENGILVKLNVDSNWDLMCKLRNPEVNGQGKWSVKYSGLFFLIRTVSQINQLANQGKLLRCE